MKTKSREGIYVKVLKLPKPIRKLISFGVYVLGKIQLFRLKTPQVLNFFITDKCNLRCSHCFYWKHLDKPTEELSLEQIETILKSMKNKLISVVLTGGETYMRKDLVEICKLFDKFKTKKIILATNGTLPNIIYDKTKQILDSTNLDIAVQISLDGLEETHDKIRGVKGTFKRVLETIEKLKTLNKYRNFNLSLSTTLSKKNYHEVEKLIEYTKNIGVFHGLQFVRDSDKHTFNINNSILSDFTSKDTILLEDIKDINNILEKSINESGNSLLLKITNLFNEYAINIIENKKRLLNCFAGKVDGVILTNGDVSFCEFTKPFANLKDYNYNFYKLWTSQSANQRRRMLKSCACIHPCNLVNSMRYDYNSIKKIFNVD